MNSNDNQYTIRIRSTGEKIPATKEEFDAYYRGINAFRKTQMNHGCCVCPRSKWLDCDMDCQTCPFYRSGVLSLDYQPETEDETDSDLEELLPDGVGFEEQLANAEALSDLFKRVAELMPEAIEIGNLRLDGLSEDAIGERIGIGRKTYAYRLKKLKETIQAEFPEFF